MEGEPKDQESLAIPDSHKGRYLILAAVIIVVIAAAAYILSMPRSVTTTSTTIQSTTIAATTTLIAPTTSYLNQSQAEAILGQGGTYGAYTLQASDLLNVTGGISGTGMWYNITSPPASILNEEVVTTTNQTATYNYYLNQSSSRFNQQFLKENFASNIQTGLNVSVNGMVYSYTNYTLVGTYVMPSGNVTGYVMEIIFQKNGTAGYMVSSGSTPPPSVSSVAALISSELSV